MPGLIIRDRVTFETIVDTTSLVPQYYGEVQVEAGGSGSMQLPAKESNQQYFYFVRPTNEGQPPSVSIADSGLLTWTAAISNIYNTPVGALINYGAF